MSHEWTQAQRNRAEAEALLANDDETGELLPEPILKPTDTEIAVGDLIHFELKHAAFAHDEAWPEFIGFVRSIYGGQELSFWAEVAWRSDVTWGLLIPARNILRVWIPENTHG